MTNASELLEEIFLCGEIAHKHQKTMFAGTADRETYKSDNTPLTQADLEINERLRVFAARKGLGFIGEEGNGKTTNQYILYVDPVDGTIAFKRGMNTATIAASVMYVENGYGRPLIGIIHDFQTGRTWIGDQEGPTKFFHQPGDKPIVPFTSKMPQLPYRTNIVWWPGATHNIKLVKEKVEHSSDFSNQELGGVAYGGGIVASGLIDLHMMGATSALESAAMQLIVNGAGGVSLDLEGKPLGRYKLGKVGGKVDFELPNGAIFAANMHVATQGLKLVQEAAALH